MRKREPRPSLSALPPETPRASDDLPPFARAHAAGVARVCARLHDLLIAAMERRFAEHGAAAHPHPVDHRQMKRICDATDQEIDAAIAEHERRYHGGHHVH